MKSPPDQRTIDATSRKRSDEFKEVYRQIGDKPENGESKGPRGLRLPPAGHDDLLADGQMMEVLAKLAAWSILAPAFTWNFRAGDGALT